MVYPEKYWTYSKANKKGLTDEVLDELDSFISSNSRRIKNFVIITDGEVLYNESFNGGNENSHYHQYSITKSITSLVLGIAIDRGYIESENDHIIKYIPEYKNYGNSNRELTIKHLLNMSSGLKCKYQKVNSSMGYSYNTETNGSPLMDLVMNSNYPLETLNNIPLKGVGTDFCYNTISTIFIVELLKRVLDLPYDVFVDQYLLKPLGIDDYKWDSRVKHKGYHISMKTLDLARIGLLMLNSGLWKNNRVVDKNWVKRSVTPGVVNFYGYNWWLDSKNRLFYGAGKGGQGVICIPDKNIVIAGNCHSKNGSSYGMSVLDTLYNFLLNKVR